MGSDFQIGDSSDLSSGLDNAMPSVNTNLGDIFGMAGSTDTSGLFSTGIPSSLGGTQPISTPDGSLTGSLSNIFGSAVQSAGSLVSMFSKLKSTPSASQLLGYQLASKQASASSLTMIVIIAALVVGAVILLGKKGL